MTLAYSPPVLCPPNRHRLKTPACPPLNHHPISPHNNHSLTDPTVALEAGRHPFTVVANHNATSYSGVGFALSLHDDSTDDLEMGSLSGHPPVVLPEDVGAAILRRLLDMAADYLGHRQVGG